MGERLRRGLLTRWVRPVLAVGLGGALAVWFFLTFGYRGAPAPADVTPQAASSAAPDANQAPAVVAQDPAEPSPTSVAQAEAASPFEAIDEPPPRQQRTGLQTHTVAADEVLWKIAEDYQLRPETILWANDIADPNLLLIGQQLVIPPQDGVLYTVQPGDSLADVAHRYGVDLSAIVSTNRIQDPNAVGVGIDIFLPGARPLATRPSPAVVQAPEPESEQAIAGIPPIPLPENVDALLAAGWLRALHVTDLYKSADPSSAKLQQLPGGARLERLDEFRNGRVLVRDPGDGRTRQAMTGWVNAVDLDVGRAPTPRELPLAYPADTAMDIAHVFTPYRSQLDGSPYAEANCGPTAVGMVLEAFGISVPSGQLRAAALNAQRMHGNGVGTLITALATVVRQHGLSTLDLEERGTIRRWSLDDIRAHIQARHPVIVQVRYRSLPGRGGVRYFGDHYIVVTGVVGDSFLYNDPIDVDGLGWDRIISGERLRVAMDASDRRYAYAAFAVSQ